MLYRCLTITAAAFAISGCIAGTMASSRPVYPADWPALASPSSGRVCPDLTGTYRAVSDEAAPLVYRPGGGPHEMFMFIPVGPDEPAPPLGTRLLPWHLAGEFDEGSATWSSLMDYAAQPDLGDGAGWVRIHEQPDGALLVVVGLDDETILQMTLSRRRQGLLTYKPRRYKCGGGGVVIYGAFPPPPEENPTGATHGVGARCTFYRATDGSLVMLEDAYTGVHQGTMLFEKWWRWRLVEAGQGVDPH